MAINFNALPSDKPNAIPPKGPYYATIEKAEMKPPKDTSKPPYLNLVLALKDAAGKSAGKVFDIISESDHELVRYKLQRFITALEIPITGNFELKDLCKIVQSKQLIVDITKEEKEGQAPRAVVDLFTGEVYYSMKQATEIFGGLGEPAPELDFEINAADAADANEATENEEY